MSVPREIATVIAWHDALNAGDLDRLLALSSEEIEMGGPREGGRGAQLLREWVGRAHIRLHVGRTFHRGGTVVVEECAQWHSAETGEVVGNDNVASVFRVGDGRVTAVIRHPDLPSALQAAGLDQSDELREARGSA